MTSRSLRRIALLVIAIALCGCGVDVRTKAEKTLDREDVHQLRTDAAKLYKDIFAGRSTDFLVVSGSNWPTSFSRFAPIRVVAHKDGFALVLEADGEREGGLYVVPEHMTHQPSAAARFQAERLRDGVYWYELNR